MRELCSNAISEYCKYGKSIVQFPYQIISKTERTLFSCHIELFQMSKEYCSVSISDYFKYWKSIVQFPYRIMSRTERTLFSFHIGLFQILKEHCSVMTSYHRNPQRNILKKNSLPTHFVSYSESVNSFSNEYFSENSCGHIGLF